MIFHIKQHKFSIGLHLIVHLRFGADVCGSQVTTNLKTKAFQICRVVSHHFSVSEWNYSASTSLNHAVFTVPRKWEVETLFALL